MALPFLGAERPKNHSETRHQTRHLGNRVTDRLAGAVEDHGAIKFPWEDNCQGCLPSVWQPSLPEICSRQSLRALSLIRKCLWPLGLDPKLSET